jgi:murein DD-endopeptidase MepM/ murein hydrolase activator NlpD
MRRPAASVLFGLLLLGIFGRPAWSQDAPAGEAKRIGGLVTLDPDLSARWCWSGAWRYPVGDPLDFASASPEGAPGYRVNRNVGRDGGHQGADLDNRRAGDLVRAAAHGVAIVSSDGGWNGGYGGIVVLAHRLADDEMVFSIYAHLANGSVAVTEGACVRAGQPIGRVGRTGRASTSHLHFEVRIPADPRRRSDRVRRRSPSPRPGRDDVGRPLYRLG